jgi:hypothetical protein
MRVQCVAEKLRTLTMLPLPLSLLLFRSASISLYLRHNVVVCSVKPYRVDYAIASMLPAHFSLSLAPSLTLSPRWLYLSPVSAEKKLTLYWTGP